MLETVITLTGEDETILQRIPCPRGGEVTLSVKEISGSNITHSINITDGRTFDSLATNLTGDDNDIVFTSKEAFHPNHVKTVEYDDPEQDGVNTSVAVSALAIVVTLGTDKGDKATLTMDSQAANSTVEIEANENGSAGNAYAITLFDAEANDAPLTVATHDYHEFLVTLETDSSGEQVSTAEDVVDALNSYAPFSALMTAELGNGEDGSGIVDLGVGGSLEGGGENYAITTTANELIEILTKNNYANKFWEFELADSNDGDGVLTALAETQLTGGTFGTLTEIASGGDGFAEVVTNAGAESFLVYSVTFDDAGEVQIIANALGRANKR